jgi:hypothetical protein
VNAGLRGRRSRRRTIGHPSRPKSAKFDGEAAMGRPCLATVRKAQVCTCACLVDVQACACTSFTEPGGTSHDTGSHRARDPRRGTR